MTTHVQQLAKWVSGLSRTTRHFWTATVTGASFYFVHFLSASLVDAIKLAGPWAMAFHAAFFVFVLVIIVFVYRWLTLAIEELEQQREEERATLFHAYKLCDRDIVEKIQGLEESAIKPQQFMQLLRPSVQEIQKLVQSAYQTFEAAFGKASLSEDRIDFEVTFMTQSLEDKKITIPAAANKDGRLPRSMELRKNQPGIYDNSVTADLYRAASPKVTVIPDTSSDVLAYKELYPSQKSRIRSSIVFPVLSSRNRLLGTLVVHCDRPGFFNREKEKYWSDLLEVFGKRIAVETVGLEALWALEREKLTVAGVEAPY